MSTSIDTKVVEARFDNKQFEAGVKQTMGSLDSLNKGLKLEGAAKGIQDAAAAVKNFSLNHIAHSVDSIADRFRAMSIIAITALQNITNQAIYTGQNLIKSLSIDPVKTGLEEYETNLNSIQTILANTAWQKTGLNDVNKALQELNEYSDQTIYNFSEMARNIGTFTAAGVKLDVATQAIKGIANLAAISGSNSQQAATAMYQLSQALAAGKVTLMDWNSVVNAGMGGKVFQDALMETARIHGVAIDKMVKDAGGFRNTLENGWLTGKILTETLSKFTGDLNAKQLKTMGYSKKQIAQILQMGKTAQEAATKVKTMSALINTLQEAATSGWAQTWQLIFGDFEEARELFTGANDVLGAFIKDSADMRNKVLSDWKELGGRTFLIQSISNSFNALMAIVKPIKDAFREIFPAKTGAQLFAMTSSLRDFTNSLKIGGETASKLKRTFAGVFAVLGIGWDIVKAVFKTIFHLVGAIGKGSGGVLDFTARLGDFLVKLREAIKEGNVIEKVFGNIEEVLKAPLKLIQLIGKAIHDLFGKFSSDKAIDGVDKLGEKLEPLEGVTGAISKGWKGVLSIIEKVGRVIVDVVYSILDFFGNFGRYIKDGFDGVSVTHLIGGGAVALLGALVTMLVKLFTGSAGGVMGIISDVRETIEKVTDTFNSLQNTLRATTLLQIAVAIGVLTLSVMALSKIDSEGLTRALTAITVMFGQLGAALFLFEKHLKFDDIGKMYAIVGAMAILGIAIRILTSSVKELSELSWQELATGLLGVTVLIAGLVAVVQNMPNDVKMFATAISLNVLALAVKMLAGTVKDLAALDWQELSRGLLGVGAVLGGLILFTKFVEADKGGIGQGLGLLLLATGIKILASAILDLSGLTWEKLGVAMTGMASGLLLMGAAIKLFPPDTVLAAVGIISMAGAIAIIADSLKEMGSMSWENIGKGLSAIAGSLALVGLAVSLVPPTAPLSAAGFLIVALSLGMIGKAFKSLGDMSWEAIAKGTVALLGALGVITAALLILQGGIGGAAALVVVAGALAILTPILIALGNLSWEQIGKALAVLAGFFVVLGASGALLGAAVPALLGLGAAVLLLGVGMLAAGAGILAFSIGLKALSLLGADAAKTMEAFLIKMIGLIPLVAQKIGEGVIVFAQVISKAGPAIFQAITTVLLSMIQAIEELTPKIIQVLFKLLVLLLKEMETAVPLMVRSGYKILIGILEGIRDNIQKVSTVALQIIAKFIKGIADGLPDIIQAGFDLIIKFIEGLTKAIDDNAEKMGKAGGRLATAIVKGIAKGILAGIREIKNAAVDAARAALDAAKDFLGISSPSKEFMEVGKFSMQGMAVGLSRYSTLVSDSATRVGQTAVRSLKDSLFDLNTMALADMDMNPTITPVLDLTNVKKNAESISGFFAIKPLSVESTLLNAEEAFFEHQNSQNGRDDRDDSPPASSYNFNQYNYSPKALSSGEIYRQTNNQLSVLKGALPKS